MLESERRPPKASAWLMMKRDGVAGTITAWDSGECDLWVYGDVSAAPVVPAEERVEELPERVREALGELAAVVLERMLGRRFHPSGPVHSRIAVTKFHGARVILSAMIAATQRADVELPAVVAEHRPGGSCPQRAKSARAVPAMGCAWRACHCLPRTEFSPLESPRSGRPGGTPDPPKPRARAACGRSRSDSPSSRIARRCPQYRRIRTPRGPPRCHQNGPEVVRLVVIEM